MDPSIGTFISMDSYQRSDYDPVSLHKYLYVAADPIMYVDPTGYSKEEQVIAGEGTAIVSASWAYNEPIMFKIGMNTIKQLWSLKTVETISYIATETILAIALYDILENPAYDNLIDIVAEILGDALDNIVEICEKAKVNVVTISDKIIDSLKYIKANEDQSDNNEDGKWKYKKGKKRPPILQ